jgi:hypothetical protein
MRRGRDFRANVGDDMIIEAPRKPDDRHEPNVRPAGPSGVETALMAVDAWRRGHAERLGGDCAVSVSPYGVALHHYPRGYDHSAATQSAGPSQNVARVLAAADRLRPTGCYPTEVQLAATLGLEAVS